MVNLPFADVETSLAGSILIVDDTPANLRLLSGMLAEQGYRVRMAPSGKFALMSTQANPPDLILLDIKMPGMSGYEVCEQLKADPRTRDIPVIFISALDQTEDKVKAFTFGGVDYITKPFQIEEVLARVETHLTLHALQRQLAAANAELQEANAELEASNADLQAFAHTVAHDLKSPLGIVLGYGELLKSDFEQTSPEEIVENLEESRQSVHCIVKTGYRMHGIIDALLLFASVRQAGEVESEEFDMGVVVGRVLERLAPEIEAARAEIVTPETWPTVWGYAPWIEEVWANYISNALKYGGNAEAGVAPRVELGVRDAEEGTGYRFFVCDNGPGLAPEEQAEVFTPFTRFHHTRAKGHGLGLSIVQRIVEKLGGHVGVDSAGEGQGSTFWFVLPSPT
jgi:signal transduction histidine kinase